MINGYSIFILAIVGDGALDVPRHFLQTVVTSIGGKADRGLSIIIMIKVGINTYAEQLYIRLVVRTPIR